MRCKAALNHTDDNDDDDAGGVCVCVCVCRCVYSRCFNNHSYALRLQGLQYSHGDLLGQTLLD